MQMFLPGFLSCLIKHRLVKVVSVLSDLVNFIERKGGKVSNITE
jgi:hypothetical protein